MGRNMLRTFAATAIAAFGTVGCAANMPQQAQVRYAPQPGYAPPQPVAPRVDHGPFANAGWAPVHGELFVCGGRVSNSGPIGARGEAQLYTPYIQTHAGALLRNPTQSACMSSGYGFRSRAIGGGRNHTGLDLANPAGGFIYAAGAGRVTANGWQSAYGQVIEIDHGRGVKTFYAHLDKPHPFLAVGDYVDAGQVIALMGRTGNATGVHLHYEVEINGQKVDPLSYGWQQPVYDGPVS